MRDGGGDGDGGGRFFTQKHQNNKKDSKMIE